MFFSAVQSSMAMNGSSTSVPKSPNSKPESAKFNQPGKSQVNNRSPAADNVVTPLLSLPFLPSRVQVDIPDTRPFASQPVTEKIIADSLKEPFAKTDPASADPASTVSSSAVSASTDPTLRTDLNSATKQYTAVTAAPADPPSTLPGDALRENVKTVSDTGDLSMSGEVSSRGDTGDLSMSGEASSSGDANAVTIEVLPNTESKPEALTQVRHLL